MKSLKTKLILSITAFVGVVLAIVAFVQIREQENRFVEATFLNFKSFVELTAERIASDYRLFLEADSFVYFNREINEIFLKNPDLSSVRIYSFDGEILYDSIQEKDSRYFGEKRYENDLGIKKQIISKNLSVKPINQEQAIYIKKIDSGEHIFVNFEEKLISPLGRGVKIDYFIMPVLDRYAIQYNLNYNSLEENVRLSIIRILLMFVFVMFIGVLIALFLASMITKPLMILKKGAEILSTGNFLHRVTVKTKDEIFVLAETFNQMAEKLYESTKALIYKERVGKELELAKQIQSNLIPKTIPKVLGLELSAGIIPAEEIGGDCYDFLKNDDENLFFYIGDVTGHGVPSGIVVSIANALFYAFSGRMEMDKLLAQINGILKAKTTASMFLTLVLLHWNEKNQKMSYVSAGHEQIIKYVAAERRVELLPAGGLALGMVSEMEKTLKIREISLQKDDVLILYSDGIPEAWRNEKEMYGMERFLNKVTEYGSFSSAIAIRNALLSDVHMFRKGYKQMDDITVIVVKKV